MKLSIGFVGQGFVGKNYANDFEKRGFRVIRYALEKKYRANKDRIQECNVVFIAVPTPTTPKGYDISNVEDSLRLVGRGKIAVIKSTMLPGTTKRLQKKFPSITILFSPEFLSVATAAYDAAHPFSTIVGMPQKTRKHQSAATLVSKILPKAPFTLICSGEEAEIYKYAHNVSGYTQILTFNMMYDLARHTGADWSKIQKAVEADPFICNRYASPLHKSGRGAGGACFIKDFAAFARLYEQTVNRPEGVVFLRAAERKNIALLLETKKDLHLLKGVYGSRVLRGKGKKRAKTFSVR